MNHTHSWLRDLGLTALVVCSLAVAFGACTRSEASAPAAPPPVEVPRPAVPRPALTPEAPALALVDGRLRVNPFTVDLHLSPEALRVLRDRGETVVVALVIWGPPETEITEANKKYGGDGYSVWLRREFPLQDYYLLDDLEVPLDFYEPVKDKPLIISLYAVSGRRSSENNLISVLPIEGHLEDIAGHRLHLSGSLIGEQ